MAGKSKVLSHPNKADIDRALAARESYRDIATRFGLSKSVIARYARAHFPAELAAAREVKRVANSDAIIKRLELELDRLNRVAEAAEDYLRDPENPERYVFGPRGWDIDVVYLDHSDKENTVKLKDNLQDLIDRLEEKHNIRFLHTNVRYKDPAELLINAIRSVKPQLELIAKVLGVLREKETGQGGNTLIINYVDLRKPWERNAKS